jgi:dTDP-glucose 4,6-dehydratase
MPDNRVRPLPAEDLDAVVSGVAAWDELRGARILITGGTGFIGTWLLESFARANATCRLDAVLLVLSRDPGRFLVRHPHLGGIPAIQFFPGDVASFDLPGPKADAITHVIHAAVDTDRPDAADYPGRMRQSLLDGTRHVLDVAGRCAARRGLLVGSGIVYGPQPGDLTHIHEEFETPGAANPSGPAAEYAAVRREVERIWLDAAWHGAAMERLIARCFALVGPGMPLDGTFAIGNFIGDAMRGGPIRVRGDGTPWRSYMYASDLCVWLWTILMYGQSGRPYNVGSEKGITIGDVAREVGKVLHHHGPADGAAVEIARAAAANQPVQRYVPSTRRAQTELGLSCAVELDQAIEKTARWQTTNVSPV